MNKSYCEVVIDGPFDLVKGFVLGFLEGRGIKGEAIFGDEHHIAHEGAFGQMLRFIGIREKNIHLIVGCGFHDACIQAMKNRGLEDQIRVVSTRGIKEAYFSFRYRAYNSKLGAKLKTLFFGPLPGGLRLENSEGPRRQVHPEAKGIEAYAPLHDFECLGEGEIHGPVKEIIDFYGLVEHEPMVELDDIRLVYEECRPG